MPVDKFVRNGHSVYTGINTAYLTNSFLRRDGGNTAFGAIDMNSKLLKMWWIRCLIKMLHQRIM